MPSSPKKRRGLSLATSFALVAVAAVVASFAIIVFGLNAAIHESGERSWRHNIAALGASVTREVISDPSPESMAGIASRTGLAIRYIGPSGSHTTDSEVPTAHELKKSRGKRSWQLARGFTLYRDHHNIYAVHTVGPHMVVYKRVNEHEGDWDDILLIFGGTLATLFLVSVAVIVYVRQKLRPLGEVTRQIEGFASGGVSGKGGDGPRPADEISRLADSFTSMRERVDGLLSSKETLLRNVSHEIRSPLARMRLALDMDDDKTRARLAANIAALDSLASELLDRARLDSGSEKPLLEPVDLCALARSAFEAADDGKGHITLSLPDEPVVAMGNKKLLIRCLGNMIDNSLRHSELAKGSVRIEVGTDGEWAWMRVSDQGRHLDPEEVKKAFEPFQRLESETQGGHRDGTGLGLAIVASIARALDGRIDADSPAAGGLRIKLSLPATKDKQ